MTGYVDSTASGPSYRYRVRAYNAAGQSTSNIAAVGVAADTVTINNVIYDSAAKTLTVVATSSAQPNVTLTATGYGSLPWRSANNFYRNTFTNVNTKPASVTVISSNGGSATFNLPATDTVTISNVVYDAAAHTLTVVATSSAQPNVSLTATGFGNLPWRTRNNFYRMTFTNVNTQPANVTVTSSGGGSATGAVSAIP